MKRCDNWPRVLNDFINERRNRPFVWGENDCCLFVCDWLKALVGIDPAADLGLRGSYSGALEAMRVLREHGGVAEIAAKVCAEHGWPEIKAAIAGRGDIVLLNENGRDSLGVGIGLRAVFAGEGGIQFRSNAQCVTAWRVA